MESRILKMYGEVYECDGHKIITASVHTLLKDYCNITYEKKQQSFFFANRKLYEDF